MPVGKKVTPMKKSPMKFEPVTLTIMAAAALGSAGIKAYGNWKNSKKQIEQQRDAKKQNRKRYYENVETIKGMEMNNPYAGIQTQFENPYEDLTVNTQQAEFEERRAAQNRANIMSQFGGAAGASGIAGLAQAMANQATLQRARASASIGQQESRNQAMAAQGAARVQQMEQQAEQRFAYGEYLRQQGENQRALNLANLQAGYDASKMTSKQNIQTLQNQKTSAITGGIADALNVVGQFAGAGGFSGGTGGGGGTTSMPQLSMIPDDYQLGDEITGELTNVNETNFGGGIDFEDNSMFTQGSLSSVGTESTLNTIQGLNIPQFKYDPITGTYTTVTTPSFNLQNQ